MEFDESVQDYVLEHAQSPYHRGKCCAATHCHRALNMPCGDEVEFSLRVESGIVREAWFVGRGCVISQAAASMLAQAVEGRAVSEITEFSAAHVGLIPCAIDAGPKEMLSLGVAGAAHRVARPGRLSDQAIPRSQSHNAAGVE